jgi:uncharacterized membrane-anchored protein YjiN (DUF445 family)
MYCDYHGEYVDLCNCEECERYENCSQVSRINSAEIARTKKIAHLKDKEVYKATLASFAKYTGIESAEAEIMTSGIFARALDLTEKNLTERLEYFAQKQAMEYFEAKTDQALDGCFEKVIEERVLSISSDSKANITTIQKVVTDRVAKYFDSKDSYNKRNKVSDTMEKAITKVVESKVDEALKEITDEAIDKFNKETMKTMMMGMAKAIQDNPKLLTILTASQGGS